MHSDVTPRLTPRPQSITAEMDRQFVAIREQYADRLAELEGQKREAFEVMPGVRHRTA